METQPQNCPLCASLADYYPVDYGNRKYFDCPACTQFQISVRAEKVLAEGPQQWRDGFAKAAKQAPEGKALVIRIPHPPQSPGDPSTALTSQYVERDQLPQ